MNNKLPQIIIYTDGSSRGNPGRGGWGVIIATDEKVVEFGGNETMTTNNRMELTAAIEGLTFLRDSRFRIQDSKINSNSEFLSLKSEIINHQFLIEMRVDSQYVINGITSWIHGWIRNGWMNSKKETVLNRDLWEALNSVVTKIEINGVKIAWQYTPGHVGIPGNDRADEIATGYADKKPPELFNGSRSEYIFDLNKIDAVVPNGREGSLLNKKQKKSQQEKNRQKMKAYSYLSLVGGKIMTHASWAECERQVKGMKNVKFKKAINSNDETQIIEEWTKNL